MVNNKVNEQDRYGNLLEKAKQKEAREKLDILKSIDNVIEWGKQSSRERDEEWERKKQYRDGLVERAKNRLNKEYKI